MYEIRTYFIQDSVSQLIKVEIVHESYDEAVVRFKEYIALSKSELHKNGYYNMVDTEIVIFLIDVNSNNMFPITVAKHSLYKRHGVHRTDGDVCTYYNS